MKGVSFGRHAQLRGDVVRCNCACGDKALKEDDGVDGVG